MNNLKKKSNGTGYSVLFILALFIIPFLIATAMKSANSTQTVSTTPTHEVVYATPTAVSSSVQLCVDECVKTNTRADYKELLAYCSRTCANATPTPTASSTRPVTTYNTLREFQQGLLDKGYYLGPNGADGVYGAYTQNAWHKCFSDGRCTQDAPGDQYVVPPAQGYGVPDISTGGYVAPGNGYGDISPRTGLPRTNYVHEYTRSNGTVVAPYYRSHR